jgi:hypothetical protein
MEEFKIRNFKEAHPDAVFPLVQPLTTPEIRQSQRLLRGRLAIRGEADGSVLTRRLAECETLFPAVNANDEDFDLSDVFDAIDVRKEGDVVLNWHHFETLERISLLDLVRHFDDVWYPAVDDLDVLDPHVSWIVSISHEGVVTFVKFARRGL